MNEIREKKRILRELNTRLKKRKIELLMVIANTIIVLLGLLATLMFGPSSKHEAIQYSEKLSELTKNLISSSKEVDNILLELGKVSQQRAEEMQKVEKDLEEKKKNAEELQRVVDALKKDPIIAQYIADINIASERRSAKRDYLLFVSGVILTTVVSILIQTFWGKKKNKSPDDIPS